MQNLSPRIRKARADYAEQLEIATARHRWAVAEIEDVKAGRDWWNDPEIGKN